MTEHANREEIMDYGIDKKRWEEVQAKGLDEGSHTSINDGMCAMEAAAYIAREPWSDHPKCVDVAIGAFMRSWNDALPDAERGILLPLIPLTLGTAGTAALAERRAMMAIDWFIREHTSAWLRLAGLEKQAASLAALPEIVAMSEMPSLRAPLEAVRNDASAARSAARSAAWSAAESALNGTRQKLQASAARLLERMCALTEGDAA